MLIHFLGQDWNYSSNCIIYVNFLDNNFLEVLVLRHQSICTAQNSLKLAIENDILILYCIPSSTANDSVFFFEPLTYKKQIVVIKVQCNL